MLPATSDTTRRDDLGSISPDALDSVLFDPKLSTDLALLVARVRRERQPWVVVPAAGITAWRHQDPEGWQQVSEWLAASGIAVIHI
jgi:hypothetical protein